MDNEKKQIAGNVLSQVIGRVIVLAMALVTVKLISNYSGTEGTGYYNTIITYLTFFITIADFGLFSIAVREMALHPEKKKRLIDNIFTIRVVSAAIVTTIALLVAQFTHYPSVIRHGVLIAGIFLFFNLVGSTFDMVFQTKMEMHKVSIAEISGKIASLFALFIVVYFRLNFLWVIATVAFSATITILTKLLLAKKSEVPAFGFDREIMNDIIRLALPFGMIFILNNFYFKLDTLMIFYFKGASDVGIYAVAYRVLEVTLFAAAYLSYSLKPLLSSNIKSNKGKAANAVSRGMTLLLAMSLAIAVLCIPFSRQIITFLSNSDFLSGAPVIIVLVIASSFIYLNTLMSEVLIANDNRRYLLFMAITVLLFNFIANVILIPRYSFYAAAATTLASELLLFIIGFTKSKKILNFSVDFSRMTKLILAAGVSIVLGFLLTSAGLYFIISMILIIVAYGGLAYFIDAVPKDLISEYLKSLKNRWISQAD